MSKGRQQIEGEAIDWVIRLRDASADEFDKFGQWLDADPVHRETYYEVAQAGDEYVDLQRFRRPASIDLPRNQVRPQWNRRAFFRGGLAAMLLAIAGYASISPRQTTYIVETKAGERRQIKLADGSRMNLNGGTRVVLDRRQVRSVRIERGEALFTIVHDSAHPFRVETGDVVIEDLGTVFNVIQSGHRTEVSVREGAVLFDPNGNAVNLSPGMAVHKDGDDVSVQRVRPETVGGWRRGRLSYAATPLSVIAEDLSRNLGVRVTASADVANVTYTGTILVEEDQEKLLSRVAALVEVTANRSGEGWLFSARARHGA